MPAGRECALNTRVLHHPTLCWTNNSQRKREEPLALQVSHQTHGALRCRSVSIWINVARWHHIVSSIYKPIDDQIALICDFSHLETADATQFVILAECHLAFVPLLHNFITSFLCTEVSFESNSEKESIINSRVA